MTSEFSMIGLAYLSGIMIPGPSLSIIIVSGLTINRKAAFLAVSGTIIGILIQTSTVLIAVNQLTENHLSIMRVFSAFFLIFLGIKSIIGIKKYMEIKTIGVKNNYISVFFNSLVIETFNPIALTFFLTVLTSLIGEIDFFDSFFCIFEFLIIGILWFSPIAFISTSQKVLSIFIHHISKIYIFSGLIFIFFGLYTLFTKF
jgi:threonine/homoserine/homoserine lactone efflux protein